MSGFLYNLTRTTHLGNGIFHNKHISHVAEHSKVFFEFLAGCLPAKPTDEKFSWCWVSGTTILTAGRASPTWTWMGSIHGHHFVMVTFQQSIGFSHRSTETESKMLCKVQLGFGFAGNFFLFVLSNLCSRFKSYFNIRFTFQQNSVTYP